MKNIKNRILLSWLFLCVIYSALFLPAVIAKENTQTLSPPLQIENLKSPASAGQNVSLYFSWHTYGSIIKNKTIFPENPELVAQFYKNPADFPKLKSIFDQANRILDINFYEYIQGDLASKKKSDVLIAHILFCYGLAEQWQDGFKGNIKKVTFTSGGVFASLLFEQVITMEDALPFIREFYEYLWPNAKEIAEGEANIHSAVLKGSENEDILNLINTIILLNSDLNSVFVKEMRWYNQVIISGNKEQVDIVTDIYTKGGNSKYAGQYFVPLDMFGEPIQQDPRHYVAHIYKDLAVHIPLLQEPDWFKDRLKNFQINKPKHGIIGSRFDYLNETTPEALISFLRNAIFSQINTVSSFEDLIYSSEMIFTIGAPQWFLDEVPRIKANTTILKAPEQSISLISSEPSKLYKADPEKLKKQEDQAAQTIQRFTREMESKENPIQKSPAAEIISVQEDFNSPVLQSI